MYCCTKVRIAATFPPPVGGCWVAEAETVAAGDVGVDALADCDGCDEADGVRVAEWRGFVDAPPIGPSWALGPGSGWSSTQARAATPTRAARPSSNANRPGRRRSTSARDSVRSVTRGSASTCGSTIVSAGAGSVAASAMVGADSSATDGGPAAR